MNTTVYAAGVLFLLALAGCSTAPGDGVVVTESDGTAPTAESNAEAVEEPNATSTPAPTGPGEVCDPHNLNDVICAAFYPDQAVLNMSAVGRAAEPLASMSDGAKLDLAHAACEAMANGATSETLELVGSTDPDRPTGNNFAVFAAGQIAYCPEFIQDDNVAWALSAYADMGEPAAQESFKDGVFLQR